MHCGHDDFTSFCECATQELSAIVPAREKQTIVKTAISKVHIYYFKKLDFDLDAAVRVSIQKECSFCLNDSLRCYLFDAIIWHIFGSSVQQYNCSLIFIEQFTISAQFWFVYSYSFPSNSRFTISNPFVCVVFH